MFKCLINESTFRGKYTCVGIGTGGLTEDDLVCAALVEFPCRGSKVEYTDCTMLCPEFARFR